MKKDKEWFKGLINEEGIVVDMHLLGRLDEQYWKNENIKINKGRLFYLIDKLDEPEVLSQEWIDENKSLINGRSTNPDGTEGDCHDAHYIHVLELQNLLVPKQELPVIPKFVGEWIESRKNNYPFDVIGAYLRMNEPFANEQTREVLSWIHESELNRGSFARAWLDGFTVEEEQLFYVVGKDNTAILSKGIDGNPYPREGVFSDYFVGHEDYMLTEKEIKDYDPRYWAFAKPVEELEEWK